MAGHTHIYIYMAGLHSGGSADLDGGEPQCIVWGEAPPTPPPLPHIEWVLLIPGVSKAEILQSL